MKQITDKKREKRVSSRGFGVFEAPTL